MKNGYTRVDKSENYYKHFDNYRIYFDLDLHKMTYRSNSKIEIEIVYNFSKKVLEYTNNNENIIFNYHIVEERLNCIQGNCDNYQEILEDILDLFYKQIQ